MGTRTNEAPGEVRIACTHCEKMFNRTEKQIKYYRRICSSCFNGWRRERTKLLASGEHVPTRKEQLATQREYRRFQSFSETNFVFNFRGEIKL